MSMTDMQHDHVVTAFFDTKAAAEKAKVQVVALGLGEDTVTITEGQGSAGYTGQRSTTGTGNEGLWGSLKNIFAPEEDQHAYAEGLQRGGYLLTVHTSEAHYDRVLHILDQEGAVDMNEREAEWRKEGWTGQNENYATAYGTSTAASGVGTSTAGTQTGLMGRTGSSAATTTAATGTAGAATGRTGVLGEAGALGDETIQLAEERLRVGKRDVNHGRVRLRSYVVEKPVNESVSLHSERVDVSRRPVDRALAPGENLFQERTISAEEHEEEAVVSKDARVVEEISLGKVAQDRTQEIRDTVRKTEVEVEDERNGRVAGRTATDVESTKGVPAGTTKKI